MMQFLLNRTMLVCVALFSLCQFSFAQSNDALDIAQKYLQENAKEFRLTASDLQDYTVRDNYVSAHNGVTHLYLIQTHAGTEVYNGMININILPNGEVLNAGNRFVSDLQSRVNTTVPLLSARQAIEKVIAHFNVETQIPYVLTETERISEREVIFQHDGIALEPIKTKLVYQPTENKTVRLAWMIQLYERSADNWWNARIDAVTSEVLNYNNQVIKCDFGSPAEVCAEAHHHTHTAAAAMDDDVNNAYAVFPLFTESPNHGTHTLVVAPADPDASPFGWHDTDGTEGHEFSITRGNNVHAYQDIFATNSSAGDEPDGGDSLVFDFPFDPDNNFPYTQTDAATTNLFYWNNLMHDVWYKYGFDEVSGNFQENNYGNGGDAGDYVRAECLDGSGTNNANFGTGADGSTGRMQMYFWGGGSPPTQGGNATLEVTDPEDLGDYNITPGGFGTILPGEDEPLEGALVLADDGTGVTSDACEDLINGADLDGNIALIDRGTCEFGFKSLAAEEAGAIAVIICNNNPGEGTITMGAGAVGGQVTIPALMMSFEDCEEIKAEMPGVTVSLYAAESSIPTPGPQGIDGDFDSGIVAHEYGHGISIRLTGGPNTGGCLGNVEQMGEGWSDWFGLVMTTTAEDTPEEGRGIGTFAINQPTTGNGIRTYRYSRSMSVNPHTYADIVDESVPHGVGSVWCAMIWDMYWNLVDVYGFDDDIYNGSGGNNIAMQLVMDGLKLQSCNPTFIDGRDAILAADMANYDGANQCLIWETFARRGLGFYATAGGNEDFDMPLLCSEAIGIEKTGDGSAFAGEEVTYTLEIANGTGEVTDFVITDVLPGNVTYVEGSSTCGTTVENNGVLTMTIEVLPALQITTCSYTVTVEEGMYSQFSFEDDLEDGTDNWIISGSGAASWDESTANPFSGTTSIFAPNPESESDQYFTIAESVTLSTDSPALGFYHDYDTEEGWDGGVVEILFDGSEGWLDLGNYMTANGYPGPVNDNPASAISGRDAFHGDSDGYIYTLIDLSFFAGETVDIRFRFASDGFVGGIGWHVDDIQIFDSLVEMENVACITNQEGDEVCSEAVTTLFGTMTSTSEITSNDPRVAMFPNPTAGRFALEVTANTAQNAVVNVYGTDGRLLLSDNFATGERYAADMSAYGAGVYFVEVITDELQTVRKLVVR